MLIAIPCDAPGGLDAPISDHFGHSNMFTLVQVDNDQVGEVKIIPNQAHSQGGCMGPVMLLKDNGAQALVAGGMGMRPLSGFQQVGITVYHKADATTVREAVEGIIAGTCREFDQQHTCGGHEGGCGHHHEDPFEGYVTVEGPVEKDRVVRFSYELFASDELVDTAEDIRYLQGESQIIPGLEQAIEGHVAGDSFEVTLTPEQGYGDRDESKTVEVAIERLPPGLKAGDTVQAQSPDGRAMPLTVLSMSDTSATLDTNHPLAGKTIHFKVKVLEVLTSPK